MYTRDVKYSIEFDEEKNILLKHTRGIDFEDILNTINRGGLVADIVNPSGKYPCQRIFLVHIGDYIYAVPYVQNKKGEIFLKTLYPSRRFTKKYLKK